MLFSQTTLVTVTVPHRTATPSPTRATSYSPGSWSTWPSAGSPKGPRGHVADPSELGCRGEPRRETGEVGQLSLGPDPVVRRSAANPSEYVGHREVDVAAGQGLVIGHHDGFGVVMAFPSRESQRRGSQLGAIQ